MPATADSSGALELKAKIDEQGNVVRELKSKKADKVGDFIGIPLLPL